jgi:hypothetical protein
LDGITNGNAPVYKLIEIRKQEEKAMHDPGLTF